jgi:hypothetical protein
MYASCMYAWVCFGVCMYACIYGCMGVCRYGCMYGYVCVLVCMHAYVCMYVHTYALMCVCMHAYTCTCAFTHTHTHTHTHTPRGCKNVAFRLTRRQDGRVWGRGHMPHVHIGLSHPPRAWCIAEEAARVGDLSYTHIHTYKHTRILYNTI